MRNQKISLIESISNFKNDNYQKVYYFGIIDYLSKYTNKKKIERTIKSLGREMYLENLSVAPPEYYGDRFENFMAKNVLVMKEGARYNKKIFM